MTFLLTAAHVFDSVNKPPVQLGTDGPVLPITGQFQRIRAIKTKQRDWTDKLDIAAYRLPPAAVASLRPSSILTLEDLDPGILTPWIQPNAYYVLVGYPSTLQPSHVERDGLEVRVYTLLARRSPLEDYVGLGLDPTMNLLLAFKKTGVIREEGFSNAPDLRGASGGGIWRLPGFPDSGESGQLAAIGIEWLRGKPKAVLGTYLGLLLQNLHEDEPDGDVACALRAWADHAI